MSQLDNDKKELKHHFDLLAKGLMGSVEYLEKKVAKQASQMSTENAKEFKVGLESDELKEQAAKNISNLKNEIGGLFKLVENM